MNEQRTSTNTNVHAGSDLHQETDASPGSKMDHRTKICILVIVLGLANFVGYTVTYSILWGEAVNGDILVRDGEFVYQLQSGKEVSKGEFIYSGVHSISIWPTVMAVVLAMLTLAKDRIVDSMHAAVVRGRTVCTSIAVLIAISMSGLTFLFTRHFIAHFEDARMELREQQTPPATQRGDTQPAGRRG